LIVADAMNGPAAPEVIRPDWPAPASVRAAVTTRAGGVSRGPYASLNLGDHVGDDPLAVAQNRARLRAALDLAAEPSWLKQVHGIDVVEAGYGETGTVADGSYTDMMGTVCAVLTADCLPVLLCTRDGDRVAALHAGWRGLAAGVLEAGVLAMRAPGAELLAWLGPGIGADAYEVGDDVYRACTADAAAAGAFRANGPGKWFADMGALARLRLQGMGVEAVYGGGFCTWRERDRFFSYRRDGVTGRFATLIWLD
jgi:polyphenol oxidase